MVYNRDATYLFRITKPVLWLPVGHVIGTRALLNWLTLSGINQLHSLKYLEVIAEITPPKEKVEVSWNILADENSKE